MFYGPSTGFSYKPPKASKKPKKKAYGHPVALTCYGCGMWVVGLYAPVSRRRVFVSLDAFHAAPYSVYVHELHGNTHFHPLPDRKTPRV